MLKNVINIGYVSELTDFSTEKAVFSCVRGRKHSATSTAGVTADGARKILWYRV
jgi:hypothetical protein